jgi:rod shape-determining protein MreC
MTEDKNSKYLNILLFNDMTNLEHVYLINNIDANEIINLEKEIKDVE